MQVLGKQRPIIMLLVAVCPLLLLAGPALATTYYVDGSNGDDSNGSGTSSAPFQTLKRAVSELGPGDVLIVRDGVYRGEENNLSGPYGGYDGMPSGSQGSYITIRAENYLGAIIDGGDQYQPVFIWNASYLVFENLHFRNCSPHNGGASFRAQDCHHIKVLNCVSEEAHFGHFWLRNSRFCLVEDCAAWGRGAYSFAAVGEYDDYTMSQYNVFRRCLARRDVHYYPDHQANHFASFVAYWADRTYFFNCVSVDGIHVDDEGNVPDDEWIATASFFTTNGASNMVASGCVVVNDTGQAASCSPGDREAILFANNAIALANNSTFGILAFAADARFSAVNNTVTNVRGIGDWQGQGIGEVEGSVQAVRNNLLFGNRIGLDRVSGSHSYNVLYNDLDYNETSPGAGEVTNLDPLANGLDYLLRIEAGSALASMGEDGGRVGAEVVYRLGVSGSLYGEAGWNTLTDEPLWPWPNEGEIKRLMAAYNRHGVNGQRGYCASGNGLYGGPITLTSYLWELLGNPAPAEVVGNGCSAPLITSQPRSQTVSSGSSVTLTVAASGTTPLSYQWYRGNSGDTGNPVSSATGASYTTPALTASTSYWVRVNNSCGSTDSTTATISVGAAAGWLYVVPAVAHNPGTGGTIWRSDLAVLNRSGSAASLALTFLPTSGTARNGTLSVADDSVTEEVNVLESVIGLSPSDNLGGSLLIASDQPVSINCRTYNQTASGTYGQLLPAVTEADSLTAGTTGYLSPVKKTTSFRTNIGVVNVGTGSATVEVRLYGSSGSQVGSPTRLTVPAGAWQQANDIFSSAGAGNQNVAFATVVVENQGAQVWAYASIVDSRTGDPTTIPLRTE